MAHLSQKLFQLGAVSLQLCNLMAQAPHCLRIHYTCLAIPPASPAIALSMLME